MSESVSIPKAKQVVRFQVGIQEIDAVLLTRICNRGSAGYIIDYWFPIFSPDEVKTSLRYDPNEKQWYYHVKGGESSAGETTRVEVTIID